MLPHAQGAAVALRVDAHGRHHAAPATVEAWARQIKLHYTYDADGGIISTVEAVNRALGISSQPANDGKLGPNDL